MNLIFVFDQIDCAGRDVYRRVCLRSWAGYLGVGVGGSVGLGGARGVLYLLLRVFWLLFNFSRGGGAELCLHPNLRFS